jgi:hypothetical protein
VRNSYGNKPGSTPFSLHRWHAAHKTKGRGRCRCPRLDPTRGRVNMGPSRLARALARLLCPADPDCGETWPRTRWPEREAGVAADGWWRWLCRSRFAVRGAAAHLAQGTGHGGRALHRANGGRGRFTPLYTQCAQSRTPPALLCPLPPQAKRVRVGSPSSLFLLRRFHTFPGR